LLIPGAEFGEFLTGRVETVSFKEGVGSPGLMRFEGLAVSGIGFRFATEVGYSEFDLDQQRVAEIICDDRRDIFIAADVDSHSSELDADLWVIGTEVPDDTSGVGVKTLRERE